MNQKYQRQFTKHDSFCKILEFVLLLYASEIIEELFFKSLNFLNSPTIYKMLY